MLNERRRRVLRALVEEYIESAIPVGSRTLVERYELGCSPATVRNELSILEETGYVAQPHVSAGRVPTDSGYRSFVDELLDGVPVDSEGGTGQLAMQHYVELDDLLRATSAALTQLTRCLAITVAPSLTSARVKRVDLLSLSPRRALFVLITESGQVVNRSIELSGQTEPEALSRVERSLNAAVVGKRASEITPLMDALGDTSYGDVDGRLLGEVLHEIIDALGEADRDRLRHGGVTALLAQPEFHEADRAMPLIGFLEDGISVLDALSDSLSDEDLVIRIGHENRREELGNVSIVATGYRVGDSDGFVGVVGPTRMDYPRVIGAVRSAARGLSRAMGGE